MIIFYEDHLNTDMVLRQGILQLGRPHNFAKLEHLETVKGDAVIIQLLKQAYTGTIPRKLDHHNLRKYRGHQGQLEKLQNYLS